MQGNVYICTCVVLSLYGIVFVYINQNQSIQKYHDQINYPDPIDILLVFHYHNLNQHIMIVHHTNPINITNLFGSVDGYCGLHGIVLSILSFAVDVPIQLLIFDFSVIKCVS